MCVRVCVLWRKQRKHRGNCLQSQLKSNALLSSHQVCSIDTIDAIRSSLFITFFPIPSSVHLTCLSFSSPHPPIIICSVHFLDCLFFFSVSHFTAFSPLFPVCLIYPSIMSSLWFFIFCPHSCHPGSIILLLSQSLLSPAYISPSLISPQLPVFSSTRRGHIAGKHSPLPA